MAAQVKLALRNMLFWLRNTVVQQYLLFCPLLTSWHRLRLHQAWWSDKEQAAPLTVATGLTDTRLDQLAAQCASWKGPLSAAVYLVLSENSTNGLSPANQKQLDDVAAQIAVFHKK